MTDVKTVMKRSLPVTVLPLRISCKEVLGAMYRRKLRVARNKIEPTGRADDWAYDLLP